MPLRGEILSPSYRIGHRIRDGLEPPRPTGSPQKTDVVIIGGGISGLAAAWRLANAGIERFVVLELESLPGGTARGGQSPVTAYPWGAHYVPVPFPENRALIVLLREMRVIERIDTSGAPIIEEQFLCRDPSERVFHNGQWQEGLYPFEGASDTDLAELRAFRAEIARWASFRDSRGRRAFSIPTAYSSDDPAVTALDNQSMAAWMNSHRWTSPRLRWLVDYSCRDDYGSTSEQTSAWAGVFYFASRLRTPHGESQPVITWPEGNARIAQFLAERAGDRLRCGLAVVQIHSRGGNESPVAVTAIDTETDKTLSIEARHAIFAAPQMLAPYLIQDLPAERRRQSEQFEYSPWLVANVHLRSRPQELSFPLCWDNVIYGSRSLGYVTATHQTGIDFGPTVLTWYRALCDSAWSGSEGNAASKETLARSRQRVFDLSWNEAVEMVFEDLSGPHPEIRELADRVDIMKWGHAMVRPRPGFLFSAARREASRPWNRIHFAGTDLSGVALCEEAVYHGVRAAEDVAHAMGRKVDSLS